MLSPFRRAAVPLLARRPEGAAPAASPAQPGLHPILRLQQALGNRVVQRLLSPEGEQEAPQGQAAPEASPAGTAEAAAETPPATAAAAPPLGHAPAPPGMAACPDAPPRKNLTVTCPSTATGPLELPVPSTAPFGGDPDRARFARELAQCRAARKVKEEIEKRYQEDKTKARKRATEEAKTETDAAIETAAKNPDLDKNDQRAVNRARTNAATAAKRAAEVKVAAAVAAVTRQDPALVEAELATAYEQEYAADYAVTLQAAINRYGKSWKNIAQHRLNQARLKITRQKNAKPKVPKGQTPPAPKTAEQIAAEIEAEMVPVRCEQEEWLLNRLEAVGFAWAVGRREQLDFLTIPQKAAYMKGFAPSYQAAKADLVEIPVYLRDQIKEKMPPIAPELADFLRRLAADRGAPRFQAGNYAGHGIGVFLDKGFSVDLFLQAALDRRGFYEPAQAVAFLLAIDRTAKALGARWRVVYDDFVVAQKVNSITGVYNVGFQGSIHNGLLNWHGPDPLILHFHLDLEIKQAVPAGAVCEAPDPDGGVCRAE